MKLHFLHLRHFLRSRHSKEGVLSSILIYFRYYMGESEQLQSAKSIRFHFMVLLSLRSTSTFRFCNLTNCHRYCNSACPLYRNISLFCTRIRCSASLLSGSDNRGYWLYTGPQLGRRTQSTMPPPLQEPQVK